MLLDLDPSNFEAIAVHEFGHNVFALRHETERDDFERWWDWEEDCGYEYPNNPGHSKIGPNDVNSVMNRSYCKESVAKFADYPYLTPVDILSAVEIYGRKPTEALVSIGGRCLDCIGGKITAGTKLQTYRCHGGQNQKWDIWGGIWSVLSNPTGPIEVSVPSTASGTQAELNNSNYGYNFKMPEFEIVGMGGWCLTDKNGGYVRFEPSRGTRDQLWRIAYPGQRIRAIQSVASNKCLTKSGEWIKTGSSGALNVYFLEGGIIRIGDQYSELACLDVAGGYNSFNYEFYPYVKTYRCKDDEDCEYQNQRWVLRGELKELTSGKCLDVRGNTTDERAAVQIYPCNGGDNQKWTWYF